MIGGGLLGLEAAYGLKQRGMEVSVVHLADWLLERQLDPAAAQLLQASLETRGLRMLLGRQTAALLDDGHGAVTAAKLVDGETLPAKLVVMAVGIRPNIALAASAGLHCERGVVVSDALQTFDPRIYAVGECVSHRGVCYGLVAPLFEQAKVCANHLAQLGSSRYQGSVMATKLKVTGIDLFSAGDFIGGGDCEEIVLSDPAGGLYKKLVLREDKLVGVCLYGDTADGAWYFKLLREQRAIGDLRERLIFGETAIGDVGVQGQSRAAGMRDDDEVCGCNGVSKGAIVKAIKENGLFTLDEVKMHQGRQLLRLLQRPGGADPDEHGGFQLPGDPQDQGRLRLHRSQPRRGAQSHTRPPPAGPRRGLPLPEWRTPNGCASCRPAINYYPVHLAARGGGRSAKPLRQRAGTRQYPEGRHLSVIPQMKGGVTNAAELRRIADVADKYQVPMLKVTGGQRIDLLGIRKEDLIDVWKDLGMQSGHAYGKSIRHRENLRRQRILPFRHSEQHPDGHRPGNHAGQYVGAAQGRWRCPAAVAQLRAEAGIKRRGRDRGGIPAGELYAAGGNGWYQALRWPYLRAR